MEHLTNDILVKRLKLANNKYHKLLEQSRGTYGAKAKIETEALSELSAALEELNVTAEELEMQNVALRDAYAHVERERAHYEELFNLVPDAYLVTDAFATVLEANAAAEEMLQLSADRLRGKPLAVFIADEHRKEFRSAFHVIRSDDRRMETTVIVTPRASTPFRAMLRVGRIHDGSPNPRFGWMIRDTTEKQRVATLGQRVVEEQQARIDAERAARRFRVLAEASRHLATETDLTRICQGLAKAIIKFAADHCEIYTVEGEQLVSQARVNREPRQAPFIDALRNRHNLMADNPASLIHRAIATGQPEVSPEFNDSGIERRDLFAEIRASGPRNALVLPLSNAGSVFGAIVIMGSSPVPEFGVEDMGVFLEIASRASLAIANGQMFQAVARANREKSDFLALLSHELRTPLTAVIGYAELLLAHIPDETPSSVHGHVERIRECSWHQLSIVDEILLYARIDSGHDTPVMMETDVATVIHEAEGIATAGANRDVALNIDLPAGSLIMRTDAPKLRQILVNLLANAFKFTDEGAVSLSVRRNDDDVYFTVADTGVGISADDMPHIFSAFWRATAAHAPRPGNGLGLAISEKLARSLGGELNAQSQLGVGTSITLRLPIGR